MGWVREMGAHEEDERRREEEGGEERSKDGREDGKGLRWRRRMTPHERGWTSLATSWYSPPASKK
jgi:hypothetical protein